MYGEPVNVQARDDGRPVRFVWRGRLYTVRAIEEHWVVSREWWQGPGPPRPDQPAAAQPEAGQPQAGQPDQPAAAQPEAGQPQARQPEQPGAGQPELEFWRVEASPGQGMTTGAYELRRDAATDAWTLRVS